MNRNLLQIDCGAALLAGVLTAMLSPMLARWYGLPLTVLHAVAAANLVYGSYSGWLASRPAPRPLRAIRLLVLANAVWTAVCLALAARFFSSATWLGLAHLLLEGVFVGALAISEWRQRHRL